MQGSLELLQLSCHHREQPISEMPPQAPQLVKSLSETALTLLISLYEVANPSCFSHLYLVTILFAVENILSNVISKPLVYTNGKKFF